MGNLNLNLLKYFFDAATEQSIAKAARLNFVSQPAVSQAIRKLGLDLGTPLLIHGKNRFQLTEEGTIAFQRCQEIFSKLSDMQNELKVAPKDFSGSLRFAASPGVAITLLPERLKSFRDKYPRIIPRFKLGRAMLARQWLEDGLIELIITVDDGRFKEFEKVPIHSGKFVAITDRTHSPGPGSLGYMIGGPYRPEVVALARWYEKKYKQRLPITYEIESWEVITKFALNGLGIGLVPDYILNRMTARERKQFRKIEIPDLPYEVCAFFKKRQRLSRNSELFLAQLSI